MVIVGRVYRQNQEDVRCARIRRKTIIMCAATRTKLCQRLDEDEGDARALAGLRMVLAHGTDGS